MFRKLFSLLVLVVLFSSPMAFSQGCEEPEGDGESGAKVFGFIQPQYEIHLTDPGTNSFKFKRARLGLTGAIPYDFSYYVVLEMSPYVSPTGNPYLLDAFVTYKRFKWAKVSVGSFKMPFGQEVNTSCSGLHTVNRSLASDYFVLPQRDMGVMILGGDKESMVNYSLAIMNGTGIGGVTLDNNTNKDFAGRVTVKPIEFVRIGASFRYGFPNREVSDVTENRMSYAAEMQFNYGNILVQAEYIYDEGDYAAGAGGCGATETIIFGDKRNGLYAMGMYMTPWNLQPIVKYEFMNTDLTDDAANTQYSYITAGANYFFNEATRLQLNYRYNVNVANKDEILVQVQIKF